MPRSGSAQVAGGGLSRDPIALKVKVIEALGYLMRNTENEAWDSDLFTPYCTSDALPVQSEAYFGFTVFESRGVPSRDGVRRAFR